MMHSIVIAPGYSTELEGKNLFLKISHSWGTEPGETKLIMTWEVFIVARGALQACGGEKLSLTQI